MFAAILFGLLSSLASAQVSPSPFARYVFSLGRNVSIDQRAIIEDAITRVVNAHGTGPVNLAEGRRHGLVELTPTGARELRQIDGVAIVEPEILYETIGHVTEPKALHLAFALRPDLSNDDVRETYTDLLTLVLAHGKGELHRAPDAKTGHAVLGAGSLEGVLALNGLEFVSANGTARDGMQVGEYRVALARELTTEQSRDVAVFELARNKLIANVTHYYRLGQFIARIPRANVDLIRSLDGIASVTPSGADAQARRACEPEFL